MQVNQRMKNRYQLRGKLRWIAMVGIIGASLFIASFILGDTKTRPTEQCRCNNKNEDRPTSMQLRAILHYATSEVVPIQSRSEISVTLEVLKSLNRPCNFLIFGLGHDSLMWTSFNPRGNTLFLEDNPKWVQTVQNDLPEVQALIVRYRTQVRDADELLAVSRSEPACLPARGLRGNVRCKLALHDLPNEVYEKDWDLVMIDAPKGYSDELPGRMSPIYSAAVMARNRRGPGVTHVFLHNVDRKIEKAYSEEFLCMKNLVNGAGRLWHFQIPPTGNHTPHDDHFC